MKEMLGNLRLFIFSSILLGIVYPVVITVIAQVAMPHQANGSLLMMQGKVIGSALIAQKTSGEKYFWPRPSNLDYNPLPSGGSNLGPTSKVLKEAIEERLKSFGTLPSQKIPVEMLFSSGSGLDPHLSLEGAFFQVERIAKKRGLKEEDLVKMINDSVENFTLGYFASPVVNVLELNIKLDQLPSKNQSNEQ